MDRSEWVRVPKEVRDLYQFMVAAFSPFTSQQEQIAISLKKAKDAMLAAAPPPPAEQASGEQFEAWLDRDWPLWRNNPDNPNVARLRRCWEVALSTPQARPDGGEARAWQEGYAQGVQDERISEANIGIAGFNAKVEPARVNPYGAAHPTPAPDAVARLVEAAGELRDLMEATRRGDYTPDSFTVQPVDEAIAPFIAAQQDDKP